MERKWMAEEKMNDLRMIIGKVKKRKEVQRGGMRVDNKGEQMEDRRKGGTNGKNRRGVRKKGREGGMEGTANRWEAGERRRWRLGEKKGGKIGGVEGRKKVERRDEEKRNGWGGRCKRGRERERTYNRGRKEERKTGDTKERI